LALTLLLAAAAGGMGWGIRGQYGHETGAMIAGVLIALVVGLLYCRNYSSLFTARMVALTAIGISFGGAMTYGQTIGLTHDPELVGNWAALRWGMLGLFVKGGIWFGWAGLLMGIGLGGRRYAVAETLLLILFLMALYLAGLYLLNEPFRPDARDLPRIYFSDSWTWEPDHADLQPRRECWGGLLAALVGGWAYVVVIKRDAIARNLALFGFVSGAIGFPLAQCLQAYHAWNTEWFRQGWFAPIEPYMNWWNAMETAFGVVAGAGLGLGVWLHRNTLPPPREDEVTISPSAEAILALTYAVLIAGWEFARFEPLDRLAEQSLFMGLLPVALIVGGRYAPYLIALPIVALPICGKTVRELTFHHADVRPEVSWTLFFALPLAVLLIVAANQARRGERGATGQEFSRWAVLLTAWIYYALNFAFFRWPWPWQGATARTPSTIIFFICLLLLTLACIVSRTKWRHGDAWPHRCDSCPSENPPVH
jgi:hypothetical protein